jgi:hypothetical protein
LEGWPLNRLVRWPKWDEELLAVELQELHELAFNLDLMGLNPSGIDGLLGMLRTPCSLPR